ncbi:hypothetical protein N7499_012737 [Penicillium canescens]|uniref:At2g23090-like zinc-binding domain-containing protein n=1 Tax=Penicillium canescens TaxID=5083 RepID=A0AAD6I471_PENCN|nr:uncharacterized protein N7446_000617 [Penicillium canescens]KAJ6012295.1 hypothetical protein N7522_002650 [Penicillium canescens]KAJ6030322.1 hypothetical protein N7460_010588 [Penicillium canescens]KAJ6060694.1 hypothetical protein N7444_002548 [Penicillium canescens]KAJ6064057.1 hypothetical protein N7499_012737 [Penicillium canescens]KAJ6077681.1 hypothetical protein N7446_000617 [Penicillium canescens]
MGNGAKASMKRERERNQNQTKSAKSQTKSNEKACNIQCQVCRQTFLQTTKAPAYVILSLQLLVSLSPRTPLFTLAFGLNLTNERLPSSLLEHASNKHNKGLADCFPGISA